jgi:hypothetical protein
LDSLYDRGTWDDEHEDPIESLKEALLKIIELLENERDRQLILTNSPPEVIDRLPRPLPPPLPHLPRTYKNRHGAGFITC